MRILHVVPYFPPDRSGGVGTLAKVLHNALLQSGHESHVITTGRTTGDLNVHRIAATPLGWLLRSASWCRSAKTYDVVHCHTSEPVVLAIALRLLRVQTPLVVTFHSSSATLGRAYRVHRIEGHTFGRTRVAWRYRNVTATLHELLDRLMLWLTDASVFVCRNTAIDILGAEQGHRAMVIHNPAPLPDPPGHGAGPDSGEAPPPTDLLWVGSPTLAKRTHLLPFVLRRIRESRPETTLRLVGVDFDRHRALRMLFEDLGQLDAVRAEGELPPEGLQSIYQSAHILLMPSAYEGLPLVMLEAMAHGIPCVATRVGGHGEVVVDGKSGFLVERDDVEHMARQCLKILDDQQLERDLREASRVRAVQQFGIEDKVRRYVVLWQGLLEASPEGTVG